MRTRTWPPPRILRYWAPANFLLMAWLWKVHALPWQLCGVAMMACVVWFLWSFEEPEVG